MLEVLLDLRGDDFVDEDRLATDLGEFAFDYADMQLKNLKIGVLLRKVSAILREHSIVLPVDLTLMFKALISLEGLGRQYDPEFRLIERARPFSRAPSVSREFGCRDWFAVDCIVSQAVLSTSNTRTLLKTARRRGLPPGNAGTR
jgi:predicted unusual protein kinase regulating ubiquinone biosynthesis (AarF/ABC1/UbiB family)